MQVRIRALRTAAVASVVMAGSLMAVAPSASATFPGRNGRIAFVDSGGDISTVRPDGTGLRRLTSTGDAGNPAWNPAGTKIAFERYLIDEGYNFDLFIMNADGSHLVRVTHRATAERNPQWSADGRQLAFTSDRAEGGPQPQIFRIPVEPSIGTSVQLTAKYDGGGFFSLAWDPDGRTILGSYATSDFDGDDVLSLYRLSAVDGSRFRYVRQGEEPDIRPQRDRIVYRDHYINIYTANRDGTGVVQVTHDTDPQQRGDVWNHDPTWSADGALLAYVHFDGRQLAQRGVYVSRRDGTGTRLLVRYADDPAWQPRP